MARPNPPCVCSGQRKASSPTRRITWRNLPTEIRLDIWQLLDQPEPYVFVFRREDFVEVEKAQAEKYACLGVEALRIPRPSWFKGALQCLESVEFQLDISKKARNHWAQAGWKLELAVWLETRAFLPDLDTLVIPDQCHSASLFMVLAGRKETIYHAWKTFIKHAAVTAQYVESLTARQSRLDFYRNLAQTSGYDWAEHVRMAMPNLETLAILQGPPSPWPDDVLPGDHSLRLAAWCSRPGEVADDDVDVAIEIAAQRLETVAVEFREELQNAITVLRGYQRPQIPEMLREWAQDLKDTRETFNLGHVEVSAKKLVHCVVSAG